MYSGELRYEGKLVQSSNPLPTNDVSQASDTTAIPGETVTFVGKNAIGATGVISLDKKPILNQIKDKVGSYWGRNKNKSWKTDGDDTKAGVAVSVTETAGSADAVIRTAGFDLEKLFESSGTGRFVLRVYDDGGGSLYGWIGGIAASGGTYTFDVYSEAGLSNQDWVGTLADFDGTPRNAEIYSYESSFAWVTGTVLTKEVGYNPILDDIHTIKTLNNGEYAIDYGNSRILYRRAQTGATDTCNYTTGAASTAALVAADINVEQLNGATLVADDAASPATDYPLPVGGQYNATLPTYSDGDRTILQFDAEGKLIVNASVDSEITIPPYTHSSGRGDFSAAFTSDTTITLSSNPSIASNQLAFITYTPSGGTLAKTLVNGLGGVTLTISSNVITVDGAGTPFASGDVYDVGVNLQDKGYDPSTQSNKNSILNPEHAHYTSAEHVIDVADVSADTYRKVIEQEGYRNACLHLNVSGGVTATIWASLDDTADATADTGWIDVSTLVLGAASLVDGSGIYFVDSYIMPDRYMIKYVTSDATNAVDAWFKKY